MSRRMIPWLVAAALLGPLFVHRAGTGVVLGVPRVGSGDEPHYLILVHSLIEDGDLDVSDDYAEARAGGDQAGENYRGTKLAHHSHVRTDEQWRPWSHGAPGPEYSSHGLGLPLLLAALVWPFRGTGVVEGVAVTLSGLATVLAMLLFRSLLRDLRVEPRRIDLITVAVFLGTPVWLYAQTLFTEPWALLLTVGAALAWMRRWDLAAGTLIAMSVLMKPTFILLGLPMLGVLLWRGSWRRGAALAAPMLAAGLLTAAIQHLLYGSMWITPQPFRATDSLLAGAVGMWISPRRGLLTLAPVLAPAVLGWWWLWRQGRAEIRALLIMFGLGFAIAMIWVDWTGAWGYGPRYLVPVMPFLALGLAAPVPWLDRGAGRAVVVVTLAASVLFQALAAAGSTSVYGIHPLELLLRMR